MYLPKLEPLLGRLVELKMIVLQTRRFRLNRASTSDARWLWNLLNNICSAFGTRVELEEDGALKLHW
jgi:poly-gamma-glutamate synthesis protein (capsule biosynthesis protein)